MGAVDPEVQHAEQRMAILGQFMTVSCQWPRQSGAKKPKNIRLLPISNQSSRLQQYGAKVTEQLGDWIHSYNGCVGFLLRTEFATTGTSITQGQYDCLCGCMRLKHIKINCQVAQYISGESRMAVRQKWVGVIIIQTESKIPRFFCGISAILRKLMQRGKGDGGA